MFTKWFETKTAEGITLVIDTESIEAMFPILRQVIMKIQFQVELSSAARRICYSLQRLSLSG